MPEHVIGLDPAAYMKNHLNVQGNTSITPEAMNEYLRCYCCKGTIHAILEDYRAAADIDLEADRADDAAGRKVTVPLHILWGGKGTVGKLWDVLAVWRTKASIVTGKPLDCGHLSPEENPPEVLDRTPNLLLSHDPILLSSFAVGGGPASVVAVTFGIHAQRPPPHEVPPARRQGALASCRAPHSQPYQMGGVSCAARPPSSPTAKEIVISTGGRRPQRRKPASLPRTLNQPHPGAPILSPPDRAMGWETPNAATRPCCCLSDQKILPTHHHIPPSKNHNPTTKSAQSTTAPPAVNGRVLAGQRSALKSKNHPYPQSLHHQKLFFSKTLSKIACQAPKRTQKPITPSPQRR